MIDLTNIFPLTDFKRKTKDLLKRMKKSGSPLVLTVNGEAKLVVQDAESYQELLALIDHYQAIYGIEKGLESARKGKSVPAKKALAAIAAKHGIPSQDNT